MKRLNFWIKWVAIALGVCGVIWLFSEIGWSKLLFHLQFVGVEGFLILLALLLLEACLDAWALKVAILDTVPFRSVLFANQMGALWNSIGPGDSGELLKMSLMRKEAQGRAFSGTVVWNVAFRLSKGILISMASILAFFLLPSHSHESALMIGFGCMGIVLYFAINWVIQKRWVGKILNLLIHIPWVHKERLEAFVSRSKEIEHEVSDFRGTHPRRYGMILALQAFARFMSLVSVVLALRFLGSGYGISLGFLIYAGLQLVSYLLPLFPTRIGTTEGASYLLFVQLGLNGEVGAIFQVLIRILQLTVAGVCIAFFSLRFFLDSRRLASQKEKIFEI
jgi:hypothetical protein